MNETDLRDCFAMMSMIGLIMTYKDSYPEAELAKRAYVIGDAMLEARKPEEEQEQGIVAVKRRYVRKEKVDG